MTWGKGLLLRVCPGRGLTETIFIAAMKSDRLTPVQRVILECVRRHPGRFSRSGLAKLLVGSTSSRVGELVEHPDYGRLAQYGRKSITTDIDILVDQGYLALDVHQLLIVSTSGGN
jgi:hypothetical protein